MASFACSAILSDATASGISQPELKEIARFDSKTLVAPGFDNFQAVEAKFGGGDWLCIAGRDIYAGSKLVADFQQSRDGIKVLVTQEVQPNFGTGSPTERVEVELRYLRAFLDDASFLIQTTRTWNVRAESLRNFNSLQLGQKIMAHGAAVHVLHSAFIDVIRGQCYRDRVNKINRVLIVDDRADSLIAAMVAAERFSNFTRKAHNPFVGFTEGFPLGPDSNTIFAVLGDDNEAVPLYRVGGRDSKVWAHAQTGRRINARSITRWKTRLPGTLA